MAFNSLGHNQSGQFYLTFFERIRNGFETAGLQKSGERNGSFQNLSNHSLCKQGIHSALTSSSGNAKRITKERSSLCASQLTRSAKRFQPKKALKSKTGTAKKRSLRENLSM